MAYPYITADHLRQRLSPYVVTRLYDDANVGAAETGAGGPVEALIRDASAKVAGKLRGVYSLDAVAANTPSEVVRLTLDVAEAMGAKRHPEVIRGKNWMELWDAVSRELNDLRTGKSSLDVEGTPEPSATVGAEVYSGDPDLPDPGPQTFLNGTGCF